MTTSHLTDLLFSLEQEELLQQEIAELDDAIACQIHVLDAVTQEIVGTANVQLWVMVEDSVNILRQVQLSILIDMFNVAWPLPTFDFIDYPFCLTTFFGA